MPRAKPPEPPEPVSLDDALRQLALKVTNAALKGAFSPDHDAMVETLKVAGNFSASAKRSKRGSDDPDDNDTMSSIQRRINGAGSQQGGHA